MFVTVAALTVVTLLPGCETSAQTGALGGAGLGALIGQAAGGNTEATLIGAGIGTGVGYLIGNEMDKKKARQMSAKTRTASYAHSEVDPLGGTRWLVVDVVPRGYGGPYISKIIEFKPNARVIITTTKQDGTVEVTDEQYRVVGDTLIVNRPGYLINAKFGLMGDQLIITTPDFRAVLQNMKM